jgi:hypothetical protein
MYHTMVQPASSARIDTAPDGQINRDGGDGAASDGAGAEAAVPHSSPQKTLRRKINFLCQIKLICPVQSLAKKYFCFSESKSLLYSIPSRPTKGAYPDRQRRGAGCGGRGSVRRASDRRAGFP